MALRLDLFCEDAGHEAFARAVTERLAVEAAAEISIRIGSARAGLPRLQKELRAYTETVRHRAGAPDVLVVLADGNAVGPQARRQEIEQTDLDQVFPIHVVGTPDPCVEAWFIADPLSLSTQFSQPFIRPDTRNSSELKGCLVDFLTSADEVVMQGGIEFADEIVRGMDLYRAGRTEPTLKRFIDDMNRALQQASVPVSQAR